MVQEYLLLINIYNKIFMIVKNEILYAIKYAKDENSDDIWNPPYGYIINMT